MKEADLFVPFEQVHQERPPIELPHLGPFYEDGALTSLGYEIIDNWKFLKRTCGDEEYIVKAAEVRDRLLQDYELTQRSVKEARALLETTLGSIYEQHQAAVDEYFMKQRRTPGTVIGKLDHFLRDDLTEVMSILEDAQYIDAVGGSYSRSRAQDGCSRTKLLIAKFPQLMEERLKQPMPY